MKAQHENGKKRWYALYTRPRWEKKVDRLLKEQGVETYCPLNKVRRKWSDRVKLVEEPLFKSYVFVKIAENDKTPVRMTSGVVNFVYWNGKPGLVKEKEIEQIRKFLDDFEDMEVMAVDIKPHQDVMIDRGIFMNEKGRVIKVTNKKVHLVIESIGFALVATIDKSKVSVIRK